MAYIYHYHAIRQKGSAVQHIDGLIGREKQLSGDWDEYHLLKDGIEGGREGLTICSLSLVGETESEPSIPVSELEELIKQCSVDILDCPTKFIPEGALRLLIDKAEGE